MRKAAFGLLALLCLCLTMGAMAWNTHRRAEVLFAAYESQVSQEIVALRAKMLRAQAVARGSDLHRDTLAYLRSGSPLPNAEYGWLNEVMHPDSKSIVWMLKDWCDSGMFYPYEEAGAKIAVWASWSESDYSSTDRVLVALGTLFEFSRGDSANWALYTRRLSDEKDILGKWRTHLQRRNYSASELQRMATAIELLWNCRPNLEEGISAEYVYLSRATMLQIRHPERSFNTDQERMIDPGWRALWSRKISVVRLLGDYDDDLLRLRNIFALPVHQRVPSMRAEILMRPLRHREFQRDICRLYEMDASAQLQWTLARVATAVARYQAERGSLPPGLDALVPTYLDRIPECPETGLSLIYESGEIASPPPISSKWKVKSR